LRVVEPSGAGVRVDSSLLADTVVGSDYDPMLSKVIAHGDDRAEALARLDEALSQTAVLGVQTNIEFLRFLLADQRVRAGDLDTALLDERLADFEPLPAPDDVLAAGGLYVQCTLERRARGNLWAAPTGWRVGATPAPVRTAMRTPLRSETVSVWGLPDAARVQVGDGETVCAHAQLDPGQLNVTLDGVRREYRWAEADRHLWIADERGTWHIREAEEHKIDRAAGERPAEVVSPMPGSVIAVQVESGTQVSEGDVVLVVEAMKMEHSLAAPVSGQVEVLVSVGEQVAVDQVLARLVPEETTESKE
jgi:acetyl-CoA/propionyl-CoA carboxylase, biotin carboxylase, biotin carboxyl carrier protein